MVRPLLSFKLSVLRWINWLIQYAVVYQKRGEAIIVYDPSTRFSEEDKNEIKEK